MLDMTPTIIPKSDQINADDLLSGPRTIKVTKVSLCAEPDQPIAINFEGDNGKPYKPGKSMRRVLVNVWGTDGNAYVGRSMTLFRDEKVQFGGLAVGGIRISHLSHIKQPVTMALTATRANRKPFTVQPLAVEVEHPTQPADPLDALRDRADKVIQLLAQQTTLENVAKVQKKSSGVMADCDATDGASEIKAMLVDAFAAARERLEPSDAAEPDSMEQPA